MVSTLEETNIGRACIRYIQDNGGVVDVDSTWNRAIQNLGNSNLDNLNFESSVMGAPTEQNLIDSYNAYVADVEAQKIEVNNALDSLKTVAQSTVGIGVNSLDNTQLRALLAILLWQAGGVDPTTLEVNPLNDWVRG